MKTITVPSASQTIVFSGLTNSNPEDAVQNTTPINTELEDHQLNSTMSNNTEAYVVNTN